MNVEDCIAELRRQLESDSPIADAETINTAIRFLEKHVESTMGARVGEFQISTYYDWLVVSFRSRSREIRLMFWSRMTQVGWRRRETDLAADLAVR